jgi:hypothetical protein
MPGVSIGLGRAIYCQLWRVCQLCFQTNLVGLALIPPPLCIAGPATTAKALQKTLGAKTLAVLLVELSIMADILETLGYACYKLEGDGPLAIMAHPILETAIKSVLYVYRGATCFPLRRQLIKLLALQGAVVANNTSNACYRVAEPGQRAAPVAVVR